MVSNPTGLELWPMLLQGAFPEGLAFEVNEIIEKKKLLEDAWAKVASSSRDDGVIVGVRHPAMTMPPRSRLVAAVPREVEPVQNP